MHASHVSISSRAISDPGIYQAFSKQYCVTYSSFHTQFPSAALANTVDQEIFTKINDFFAGCLGGEN